MSADHLWHVTVLMAGSAAPLIDLRSALHRLCALDPANMGVRYRADGAEVQFWDEGPDPAAVADAAAGLWAASRAATGLPDWSVVGLEVLDRPRLQLRRRRRVALIRPGAVQEAT